MPRPPASRRAALYGGGDPDESPPGISARILELGEELRRHVATKISPIAKPKGLMFVPDLPKTRSGKIMRRLLKDIAQGRSLGDTTTLADASVVETIRDNSGKAEED